MTKEMNAWNRVSRIIKRSKSILSLLIYLAAATIGVALAVIVVSECSNEDGRTKYYREGDFK